MREVQTIYPIDRASILSGSRFDLKVEFPGLVQGPAAVVTLNGEHHQKVFGRAAHIVEREDGRDQSALILRGVSLTQPGVYKVRATDGANTREVTWEVYGTGQRQAKNVILFIGDGMSNAHRVAARLLSKGMAEGKAFGKLAMDVMPHMALVATAGSNSSSPIPRDFDERLLDRPTNRWSAPWGSMAIARAIRSTIRGSRRFPVW